MAGGKVLAIDPGREKVGAALLNQREEILHLNIITRAEIIKEIEELIDEWDLEVVVIGDGTGSHRLAEDILSVLPAELELKFIPEKGSSVKAARLYRRREGGPISRLLAPFISWRPSRPLDDYAAVVLAKKYLQKK